MTNEYIGTGAVFNNDDDDVDDDGDVVWIKAVLPGDIPATQLASNPVEQENVFNVYDAIAVHWNHTRGKRKVYWHRVKSFLDGLAPGSLLAGELLSVPLTSLHRSSVVKFSSFNRIHS